MRKELEIIKHVIELYTGDTTDAAMANYELKNSEQVKMYAAAFKEYDLSDVLKAIDDYWNFKNSKTKPTVAQILAVLNSNKEVEKNKFSVDVQPSRFDESNWRYWVGVDLARALMMRGGNKNLRFWYARAVKEIFAERVDRLPGARFWDYAAKVRKAFENGFFDDVDDVAENIRRQEVDGKPVPKEPVESGNWLALHWKAGV